MEESVFKSGVMKEYLVNITFNLKFGNKKESMVEKGDVIFFDGLNIRYVNKKGVEFVGENMSLRTAITKFKWLVLKNEKGKNSENEVSNPKVFSDYDYKKGGNFDIYSKENFGSSSKFNSGVIEDKELIVKVLDKDQTSIKAHVKSTLVSNSTSVLSLKDFKKEVVSSNDYEKSIPISIPKTGSKGGKTVKTTVVNASTPHISEDATKEDISKLQSNEDFRIVGSIKPEVIDSDGATIISKISNNSKPNTEPIVEKQDTKKDENYIDRLPEDWGNLHWMKKGKYINSLEDIGFILFILSMELSKAVQSACKKRLEDLGYKSNS